MDSINEELRTVLEDLNAGRTATPVTIRNFLHWFGVQRRTTANVEYVNNQLSRAGIRTVPDYLNIWVDTPITFELISRSKKLEPHHSLKTDEGRLALIADDGAGTKSADDPSFRIGKIESANNVPVSVKPNASLEEAITLMLARNFSQLPVMTNDRDVKGVISWSSIGARQITKIKGLDVQHFMDDHQEISANASLFAGIRIILEHNYVLIRSIDRRITGIVTSNDITRQFEETSTPFLLLAEIENNLRALLQKKLTIDDIKSACAAEYLPKEFNSISQLTFGNYVRILESDQNWKKLDLTLDRVTFCNELLAVNNIRNDVMHFDPDPLTDQDLSTLKNVAKMLDLLRTFKVF